MVRLYSKHWTSLCQCSYTSPTRLGDICNDCYVTASMELECSSTARSRTAQHRLAGCCERSLNLWCANHICAIMAWSSLHTRSTALNPPSCYPADSANLSSSRCISTIASMSPSTPSSSASSSMSTTNPAAVAAGVDASVAEEASVLSWLVGRVEDAALDPPEEDSADVCLTFWLIEVRVCCGLCCSFLRQGENAQVGNDLQPGVFFVFSPARG